MVTMVNMVTGQISMIFDMICLIIEVVVFTLVGTSGGRNPARWVRLPLR
jgi:hypothetical protein